jgi:hypothetical protein
MCKRHRRSYHQPPATHQIQNRVEAHASLTVYAIVDNLHCLPEACFQRRRNYRLKDVLEDNRHNRGVTTPMGELGPSLDGYYSFAPRHDACADIPAILETQSLSSFSKILKGVRFDHITTSQARRPCIDADFARLSKQKDTSTHWRHSRTRHAERTGA